MRLIAWVILEYAASDLDEKGEPFLIVLRSTDLPQQTIKLCLLADWITLLHCDDNEDTSYLQELIYELCQQRFRDAASVDRFFTSMETLSMGPIRTLDSGIVETSVLEVRLDGYDPTYSDTVFYPEERFDMLVRFLSHDLLAKCEMNPLRDRA